MDKFSFAHIGFGKSGSTALQTIWTRSSNCNYFSAHGLVESARNIILQNLHDLDAMVHKLNSLNLAQVILAPDGANILSSEGSTFGWLDDPNLSNAIPLKQKALANVLAPLCNNVLVVTRDPIHWIRSA